MDLRQLRSFAAVARTGSFTAAADELGYTQSAVSQHVGALEADLGSCLLTRRPVALTAAGRQLAAHARHILLRVDVARSELASASVAERIRLAVTPLSVSAPLIRSLGGIRADGGSPTLDLDVVARDEALARLASGDADAAVVDGVTAPNGPLAATEPGLLHRQLVAELPMEVLLPAGHPLAGAGGVDLVMLRDALWLDAPLLPGDPSSVPGAARPRSGGRLRYLGWDLATVARLVASGFGLALLPAGSAPDVVGLARVVVRSPQVVHRSELLTVRGRVGTAAALVAAVRTNLRDLAAARAEPAVPNRSDSVPAQDS